MVDTHPLVLYVLSLTVVTRVHPEKPSARAWIRRLFRGETCYLKAGPQATFQPPHHKYNLKISKIVAKFQAMYRKRLISEKIRKALEFFPVVAVMGARQTGKTTLVRKEFPERAYFSLDSPEVRAIMEEGALDFLSAQKDPVTLDEVQKVPSAFQIIKILVDKDRKPGRFLITGSANFLLMKNITETLAGRIAIFELPGFTLSEAENLAPSSLIKYCLEDKEAPPSPPLTSWEGPDLHEVVTRGSYPPAVLAPDPETRTMWLENYVATYLERDLRELSQVASLGDFRKVMGLAAMRTGQVLNISELARDAGLPFSTTRNYLNLLEVSYLIRKLPAYFANIGKRLVKSPKLHFRDTGLALVLSGLTPSPETLIIHPYYHALVETLLVEEIVKLTNLLRSRVTFHYFRSHGGAEVDLVLEEGERLLPIEIKATSQVSLKKLSGIRQFLQDFKDRAPFGLVIYTGERPLKLTPNLLLVPWFMALVGQ